MPAQRRIDVLRPRRGRYADGQRHGRRRAAALTQKSSAGIRLPKKGGRQAQIADDWQCAFFIHTRAKDEPSVLGRVASILGAHGVSIEAVMQRARRTTAVPVVFITHQTSEKACMAAIAEIKQLDIIEVQRNIIRVEH